jgi:5-methylcytosine-specific restriction endonuclease McrA
MADLDAIRARAERLRQTSFDEFWSTLAAAASVLRDISPSQRRIFLVSVVEEMRHEQDGLCALCHELLDSDLHVDHKIPFCYGGGNERGNLQLAHASCNQRKRNQVDARDLLRYLEDRYMNR